MSKIDQSKNNNEDILFKKNIDIYYKCPKQQLRW